MSRYWAAKGEPWRNPRLSDAERYRLRYSIDSEFNIKERLRSRHRKIAKRLKVGELIRSAINRNGGSSKVEAALGYKVADLRIHLERQFTKGMDWEKFRQGDIHIDHILPVSSFDVSDDAEFKACWALPNLRPMWAKDNIEKSAKRLHLV